MSARPLHFASKEIAFFFPEGITANTAVSKCSKFGDDYWEFYDRDNSRLNAYSPSSLTIFWRMANYDASYTPLSQATIQVVKLFAFLYLHVPEAFGSRRKRSSKNHPATVCGGIRNLLPFLSHVYEKSLLARGTLAPAESLHDVTAKHLRESLKDWDMGRGEDLQRMLIYLTSPVIQEACKGFAPRWTPADIRALSFRASLARDDYEPVFPNPLFRFISNKATDDVVGFLKFAGETPSSDITGAIPVPFNTLAPNGPAIFQAYVDLRGRQDAWNRRKDNGQYGDGREAKRRVIKRMGTNSREVFEYIRRVQEAACSLIALYTGARYSELTGFKKGCSQQIRGMWFLVGTHIKQDDIDKPANLDLWPAIPALRDALRCLELFTVFTKNQYLISALTTVKGRKGRAYSIAGLTQTLARYITRIDEDRTWVQVRVSPHRCGHTLAHQLARGDLGLVFIAHQLKHLHSALRSVPPQVTLMYGGIADLKVERAMQRPVLHYELAKSLYDPDSPIAGGGAEEFSQRRKQYFEGMLAAGTTKEDIIRSLASRAIPFSSVGMGYCLGRREIKNKDGSTQKPPCIGSLQCSPESCPNALITTDHIHLWKKVASQNRELSERPEMQHAKTELLHKVELATSILTQLGATQ